MQVGNNIVAVRQNNVEEANGLGLQNTKIAYNCCTLENIA